MDGELALFLSMQKTSLKLYGHIFADCVTMDNVFRLPHSMQNDACLSYIHQGRQELFSSTQRITASDGECVLMKCGNYIANVIEASADRPFSSIVFHFDREAVKKAFGGKTPAFLNRSLAEEPVDPALKLGKNVLMDNFVNSLWPIFDNPELATDELLEVKLQELVVILSKTDNAVAQHILGTLYTPEQIKMDDIISANLYTNMSVSELAHMCYLSESTFKREFNKLYKVSPAKYLRTKKLEKAAQLLSGSQLSVSEICWEVGFENPAHFSTLFTREYGKSPRQYRGELN